LGLCLTKLTSLRCLLGVPRCHSCFLLAASSDCGLARAVILCRSLCRGCNSRMVLLPPCRWSNVALWLWPSPGWRQCWLEWVQRPWVQQYFHRGLRVVWYTGTCFVVLDPVEMLVELASRTLFSACVASKRWVFSFLKWAMAFRTVCSASGLRSQSDTALSKTPLFVKILTKMRTYAASEMGSFPSTANFRQLVPLAKTVSIGVSGFQVLRSALSFSPSLLP
jgi:hypothetical protein